MKIYPTPPKKPAYDIADQKSKPKMEIIIQHPQTEQLMGRSGIKFKAVFAHNLRGES